MEFVFFVLFFIEWVSIAYLTSVLSLSTTLQAGRSRVGFLIRSLHSPMYPILSAALWL
jgi:hypothetical protein